MLILTRFPSQIIRINDNVKIHILPSRLPCVRIGIEAPADIIVHREEIYQKVMATKREAKPIQIRPIRDNDDYQRQIEIACLFKDKLEAIEKNIKEYLEYKETNF